jgi:hypothetical protein
LVVKVVFTSRALLEGLLLVSLDSLWHWWKCHTFWKVGEWVDELSSFLFSVVERATFSKFALTGGLPVLAWLSFVVRVNGSKSSLAEMLWEWL